MDHILVGSTPIIGPMYNLFVIDRGSKYIVMTDTWLKVKAKLKSLKNSQRKLHYKYSIEPTEEKTKYKKVHRYRSH